MTARLSGERLFRTMTARDALIDLLDRSATTFYWDMRCLGTLSVRYNECHMNVGPLEITAVGPDGKPNNPSGQIVTLSSGQRVLEYDRCGGREADGRLRTANRSRSREPNRVPGPRADECLTN
jgi:hypothetical protein